MNGASYWVNISMDGTRLGAGFLLTSCYVLTAHHCLGDAVPEGTDVDIEYAGGEVMPGRVLRLSRGADLALIDVPKSGIGPIVPRADLARTGEAWRNPYRPSLSHAFLSGRVEDPSVLYQCEGGDSVTAQQLGCVQDLGDYAGYSGSPIEGGRPDGDSKLLGVLIEQYPRHFPDHAASMVLFAATISEVFRRFECFHVSHLMGLLPYSSGGNAPEPGERRGGRPAGPGPAGSDIHARIADTGAIIAALHEWQSRGYLDERDVTALKLRAVERHLLGDDMTEKP